MAAGEEYTLIVGLANFLYSSRVCRVKVTNGDGSSTTYNGPTQEEGHMMIEVVIDATDADGELEIEENQGICWTSYVLSRTTPPAASCCRRARR